MIKNDKNIDVGLLEHEQKESPGRSFYLYGHSNDDNHNNEENFLSVLTTQGSICIPVGLFVDSLTRSLSPASFQSSGNDDIVTEVGPRQPLFPATYSTPVQEWKTPTENPEPRELHLTCVYYSLRSCLPFRRLFSFFFSLLCYLWISSSAAFIHHLPPPPNPFLPTTSSRKPKQNLHYTRSKIPNKVKHLYLFVRCYCCCSCSCHYYFLILILHCFTFY